VRAFETALLDFMRTRNASVLSNMRSNPKADVPAELGDLITSFKSEFSAAAAAGIVVDPTSVDADEVGEAHSDKTLATE
jgi:F-type H+-transporting ATPase subunit alpha